MTREEYYSNLEQASDYLQHHGVRGQKWGVENGSPYPLDKEGRIALAKQKKAAADEKKEVAKELGKTTAVYGGAGLGGTAMLAGASYITSGGASIMISPYLAVMGVGGGVVAAGSLAAAGVLKAYGSYQMHKIKKEYTS